MGSNGYDDQFNDGIFNAAIRGSSLRRPGMWPKSVSEMRGHTSYHGSWEPSAEMNHETAYSDYQLRRPYIREGHRAGMPPMMRYTTPRTALPPRTAPYRDPYHGPYQGPYQGPY